MDFKKIVEEQKIRVVFGDIEPVAESRKNIKSNNWEIYIDEKLPFSCKKFVLLHEIGHILLKHDYDAPHFNKGCVDSELELEADAFAKRYFYNDTIDYVIPEDTDEKYKLSDFDYIKYLWDNHLQFLLKKKNEIEYKDASGKVLVKSPPFKNFDV